jgi:hypothetical protein
MRFRTSFFPAAGKVDCPRQRFVIFGTSFSSNWKHRLQLQLSIIDFDPPAMLENLTGPISPPFYKII